MKSNTTLKARVLKVDCRELNERDTAYSFNVYEFSNGLILVPGDTTNDCFFDSRDRIEACGTAVVDDIEDLGEETEFSIEELLRSIQGSIQEFGVDSVPQKHHELWRKS